MKAERMKAEPVFRPVVVTLETEEEARQLLNVLNQASTVKYKATPFSYALNTTMWSKLGKVLEDC